MTFGAPQLLFALLAVPLAAIGYRVLERRRTKRSTAWSTPAMLPNIVRRPSGRLRYIPAALLLLGMTFLLVGFARPQRVLPLVSTSRGGAPTIVLALDVSGSMAATDVAPTRIRATKTFATSFLNEVPSKYRVSLITFGNEVKVIVPPTFDRQTVIKHLPAKVTTRAGTAIGDAISQSVAVISQAYGPSRPGVPYRPGAVLLVSDGAQTAGGATPQRAALFARADGIPISTVGVGTLHGAVTQKDTIGGFKVANRISVPIDTSTLSDVSLRTGGTFFLGSAAFKPAAVTHVATNVSRNIAPRNLPGHRKHELSAAAGELALLFILAGIALSGLWFGRVA